MSLPTASPGVSLPEPRTLQDLAAQHGGRVDSGAAELVITRIASMDAAHVGDLAPLLASRFLSAARASEAALLVDASLAPRVAQGRRWVHEAAAFTLAQLLEALAPVPPAHRSPEAHIDPLAEVDPTANVAPGAVILAGAVVGPHARIEPNAVIYGGAVVGARVIIGAGAVIGRPGFGWAPNGAASAGALAPNISASAGALAAAGSAGAPRAARVVRVPQLGGVRIEDDAEIGPLATVDAGTLAPTVIGRGAKLDAHVHVAHNVVVGAHTLVAAQAGFAGSVRVGAGSLVGGQAGVADHVTIGQGARLAAKAGVIGDVPPGGVVAGYPAVDKGRWLRAMARILGSPNDRAGSKPAQTQRPKR